MYRNEVSFSSFRDSQVVDASLMAQLPGHIRRQSAVQVYDSGSNVHVGRPGFGMTNGRSLADHGSMVVSG